MVLGSVKEYYSLVELDMAVLMAHVVVVMVVVVWTWREVRGRSGCVHSK